MSSVFYTEVDWVVEIDSNGNAKHKLAIKLLHLLSRIPTVDETISIELPANHPFGEFRTKIKNSDLPEGYGYIRGKYVLNFDDITQFINKSSRENTVNVSFNQGRIEHRMHDVHIVELGTFVPHLKASKINFKITLPEITNRWEKFLLHFLAMRKDREGIYSIVPRGETPQDITQTKGEIFYQLMENYFPLDFGIAYRSIGKLHVISLIVGVLIGLPASIMGNWLYNYLAGGL